MLLNYWLLNPFCRDRFILVNFDTRVDVLLWLLTCFRESEKVFGSQGLHLKSLIKYVGPFCLLWMLTSYSYVRALGVIRAADVTALFSSCNAFVYVFSLIWLWERLSIVKVRRKIGGYVFPKLSHDKTCIRNVLLVLQHCCKTRFISHVQTCFATLNQVVTSCVNTDFWLDKITRESSHTVEVRHLLQNKFALGR